MLTTCDEYILLSVVPLLLLPLRSLATGEERSFTMATFMGMVGTWVNKTSNAPTRDKHAFWMDDGF